MNRRTVRAWQRLALCAGFCAAAWVAAEGLDRGTARADVPIRIEQEQQSSERPGGLLDELLDDVLPGRGNQDPPADDDNGRGDQEPEPPTEDEPSDDNGRGGDPPAEQPRQDDDDEDDTPVRDEVEEILDEVLPDPPETPGPVDGDDGSPQHPVDTPPAPDPTPDVDPAPVPELPATPDTAEPASSDSTYTTAVWIYELTTGDRWTDLRMGGSVCDSRDDRGGAGRDGRRGASTRDRADVPRHLPGPRLVPLGTSCGPPAPTFDAYDVPATAPCPPDPGTSITAASGYLLGLDTGVAARTLRAETLPPSRLTLWPPGPG